MSRTVSEPPEDADERTLLTGLLDYYRATLGWKCEGLSDEQFRARSVPPSNLSLLGLLRHMAEVEPWWFATHVGGADYMPEYFDDAEPNRDFDGLNDHEPADVLARWKRECERSREVLSAASLDAEVPGHGHHSDKVFNVRWIVLHMIAEYARHCGHADLLREAIDGSTGD